MFRHRVLAPLVIALAMTSTQAFAQGASLWFLAEGANNATFTQEIQVGNPSASTLDVTVELLPAQDAGYATLQRTFTLGPTSRLSVRLGAGTDFALNGSASARVSAVIQGTATPADIVVERTMYFSGAAPAGSHNASGVTLDQLAEQWILAEGSGGQFETFVLVANPNPTPTLVRATFLDESGTQVVVEKQVAANARTNFWPTHPTEGNLGATPGFATVIESLTPGNSIVAERAMYFDNFNSGHDALGVTTPSTTWLFAEGFTGQGGGQAFDTYLLLVNPSSTPTSATVDFLLDNGTVVSKTYLILGRQRVTVSADHEGRTDLPALANAAFGIRVTADDPIVAERAMYWGQPSADPNTPASWREGHATAGVTAPAAKWAFAEGLQGTLESVTHETFILMANPGNTPIMVRATFVREDGKGIVRERCIGANSRANIWTRDFAELAGQRFSTFLESISSADAGCPGIAGTPFVAERAVYSGANWSAGHVNAGRPWTGTIATPPVAPPFAIVNVTPDSGRLGGGQTITITGAGFQQGARVVFENPAWTGDRNANTKRGPVDEATDVVVSPDGTTITAKTPRRDFYTGYQTAGPVTVKVINPGDATTQLANGFTFKLNILAFGDEYTLGAGANPTYPQSLEQRLAAFQKDVFTTGGAPQTPSGQKLLQFGSYVTVTNGGVAGECVSATGSGCGPVSGRQRFVSTLDAAVNGDAYDAVMILTGVNDVAANVTPGSVAFILRELVANARDRNIVIFMGKFEDTAIDSLNAAQVKALGDAIWGVTEDTSLNVEIYRQSMFRIQTSGGVPTQAGYSEMARLFFEKVARELPLQPCDARADKPGKGCPRNP